MGGHGALVIACARPGATAASRPSRRSSRRRQVPWGRKALAAYLGDDEAHWQAWDACALVARARTRTCRCVILIDQGDADEFLADQLRPQRFAEACAAAGRPLTLRLQPGYDHSYYFIASFLGDHFDHHAAAASAT
jgi:S-formylglutathione hydrolase